MLSQHYSTGTHGHVCDTWGEWIFPGNKICNDHMVVIAILFVAEREYISSVWLSVEKISSPETLGERSLLFWRTELRRTNFPEVYSGICSRWQARVKSYTPLSCLYLKTAQCCVCTTFLGKEVCFSGFGYQVVQSATKWPGCHVVLWEEPPILEIISTDLTEVCCVVRAHLMWSYQLHFQITRLATNQPN